MTRKSYHVIEALRARNLEEVDAFVAGIEELELAKVDEIIITVPDHIGRSVYDPRFSRLVGDISIRTLRVPVKLVWFDGSIFDHRIFTLYAGGKVIEDSSVDHKELVRAAVLQQAIIGAGDLPHHHHETMSFVAPSGRFCDEFFRAANVLTSDRAVDEIAFWALPHLNGVGAILMDTWSIATIGYRAIQLALSCSLPGPELRAELGQLSVSALRAHPHSDHASMIDRIRQAALRCPSDRRILFLSSVASSGRLDEAVARAFADEQISPESYSHIYIFALADTEAALADRSMIRLSKPACSADQDALARRPKIIIDPATYYPRPSSEVAVSLTARHFGLEKPTKGEVHPGTWPEQESKSYRSRLTEYLETPNVLRVHHTYFGRHFGFFIDTEALCASAAFIERLMQAVPNDCDWTVVTSADSDASRAIATIISNRLDLPFTLRKDLASVSKGGSILFVREAIASGRTLVQDSKDLRNDLKDASPTNLQYIVAFTRTLPSQRSSLKAAVTTGNAWAADLSIVDHLPLGDYCPWCEEQAVLDRARESYGFMEPPHWITERLALLATNAIPASVLLSMNDVPIPSVAAGSPVFPKGWPPVAVCFYLHIALQMMRADPDVKKRLSPGFFRSQVLDPNSLQKDHETVKQVLSLKTLDNYNEDLLRACLLRVSEPDDWGVDKQRDLVKELMAMLNTSQESFLNEEIRLLYAANTIVPAWRPDLEEKLKQLTPIPGMNPLNYQRLPE